MAKKSYTKRTPEEIRAEVTALTEQLESGVSAVFESDKYVDYLKAVSKFHDYSARNCLLILLQCPHASYVHGFQAWKKDFERHVVEGQTGIRIIARSERRIKQEMEKIDPKTQRPVFGADGKPVTEKVDITIPKYFAVSVFDISQTDGKPFPEHFYVDAQGNVENYDTLLQAIQDVAGVPFHFEQIDGGANGFYHHETKDIHIKEGMNEVATIRTCLHETAHAKLHDRDAVPESKQKDRHTKEVEAESVAFVLCQNFNVDAKETSFSYVASWSTGKEAKELLQSLDVIGDTSVKLIGEIEERYNALLKERDKETGKGKNADRPSIGDKLQKISGQMQGGSRQAQQRAEYERA